MAMIQYKPSVLLLCEALQTQLCFPSGSSLRVEPDFVPSFHPDPLRNGTILLLFLGQESLDSESLVRRHGKRPNQLEERRRVEASFFPFQGQGRTL